jgi:hypothetical protein
LGETSWGRPATFGYQPITSGSLPLLNFAQDDWLNCLSIVESEQYWTAALARTRQNGAMLAAYSTAHEIKGSPCPKCRVPMMLGRVIPEPPDFDLYTFMCPDCDYVKCVAVEMSTMQDNPPGVFPDEKPQRQPG